MFQYRIWTNSHFWICNLLNTKYVWVELQLTIISWSMNQPSAQWIHVINRKRWLSEDEYLISVQINGPKLKYIHFIKMWNSYLKETRPNRLHWGCFARGSQTKRVFDWWLTCMFVCKLDEAVGDVSPPVETYHLGFHIPTGRLKQREMTEMKLDWGDSSSLHTLLISHETCFLCVPVKLLRAAMTGWPGHQQHLWSNGWLIVSLYN